MTAGATISLYCWTRCKMSLLDDKFYVYYFLHYSVLAHFIHTVVFVQTSLEGFLCTVDVFPCLSRELINKLKSLWGQIFNTQRFLDFHFPHVGNDLKSDFSGL